MKFKKSLLLLAATVTGAGALASAPVLAAEYSTSFSGNVRVEALAKSSQADDGIADTAANGDNDDAVTTLSTGFGGDDEESSTGGDTYLQWNHAFEGDNGAASGFIRFASDGKVRINVAGSSELGSYKGEIKAEWETDDGFGGTVGERDQFAKLTNTNTGLYYKIGREEWFGNQKGYTSDFQSYTKGYADANDNTGENGLGSRISGHAFGWQGSGIHVATFLQRDNGGSASGQPLGLTGDSFDKVTNPDGRTASDIVDTLGFILGYNAGIVDVALNTASSTVSGQGSTRKQKDTSAFTELQLSLNFGSVSPFLNYGSLSVEDQNLAGTTTSKTAASGWNLGVSVALGASDLVIAYGTSAWEDSEAKFVAEVTQEQVDAEDDDNITETKDAVKPTTESARSGFDLIWATNQDPLKVSLVYASQSGTDTAATSATADTDTDVSNSVYGVRLDFGF